MVKDKTLEELLRGIKMALEDKESAERARINAEFKKKKSQYQYLHLMDCLRHKEFVI